MSAPTTCSRCRLHGAIRGRAPTGQADEARPSRPRRRDYRAKPAPLRLAQIQAVARRGQDAGCGTSGASGLARFADGEKQLSMGTGTQQRRLFQGYEDVQDV